MNLPRGTVTFLFTDIENSTRLMQEMGEAYVAAQTAHHEILRDAFRTNEGRELRTEGDSFFCVFASAIDACSAAAAAQKALSSYAWPNAQALRVRIGLHTGEAPLVGNEYIGLDVHHAARIAAAAHGGQVLISETTRGLVEGSLKPGLSLRDLGPHRLKDLARSEQVYQLIIDGVSDTFPALRTLDATHNNLPTQLTSFVGRAAEVEEGKRLLKGTRLLTLTGPGGIGKTRLSLQIAAETFSDFPAGVYFVPLSAVRDAELVPSVVAQVLGISVAGNRLPTESVADYLRDKAILLVLDNFEQLLPSGAPIATDLLKASPGVKLLVSSRAVLRVYGEQEFAVEPLGLPHEKSLPPLEKLTQYEAVKLFIERAMAARPDFTATNENAPAIAGICERVDGLPLAIELAAARTKLFSPQALLARLESSLTALGSGARDLPGRQQTLAGAIDWSYDLLDEPHRRLLNRFAVFARGANLAQAEVICGPPDEVGGDVLSGLDELADQSLLRRMPDFEEPRLIMLQTIREFTLERLEQSGEATTIRDRHADAYCALAAEAAPNLFGDQRRRWLDRLERDHDNFRDALEWCIAQGDAERAMRLATSFWRFWQMRGHLHEGRARLASILALPASNDHREARSLALEAAGGVAYWQGDLDGAAAYYNECLALTRTGGDKRALANAIYNASFPHVVGRLDVAKGLQLLEEALPIFRELGDDAGISRCQWAIASGMYYQNRIDEAIIADYEAIAIFRKADNRFGLAWALHTRALLALRQSDLATARECILEALALFEAAGDMSGIVLLLDDAAALASKLGDRSAPIRLAAAAAAVQESTGAGLGTVINLMEGRHRREYVVTDEDELAWTEGQAMTVAEAIAVANDLEQAVTRADR